MNNEEIKTPEEATEEISEETAETSVETLDEEIETAEEVIDLEQENANLKDQAMRALADAENTRRRSEREVLQARKYGAEPLARDLLPILDNLERALESTEEAPENAIIEGVKMTQKMLLDTLSRHHIKEINPIGEAFDPERHQAMCELPQDDDTPEPGHVGQVMMKGYTLHDRTLRPAMVGVIKKSD